MKTQIDHPLLSKVLFFISVFLVELVAIPGCFLFSKLSFDLPLFQLILDGGDFICAVVISLSIAVIIVYASYVVLLIMRRMRRRRVEMLRELAFQESLLTEEEILKMYEESAKRDRDVRDLIKEKEEVLIKQKITETDKDILLRLFGKIVEDPDADLKEKECIICLDSFKNEELVIMHPKCGHPFHKDCLFPSMESSQRGFVCPICREPTRIRCMLFLNNRKGLRDVLFKEQETQIEEKEDQLPAPLLIDFDLDYKKWTQKKS